MSDGPAELEIDPRTLVALVVEDDELIRLAMARALRDWGARVHEAETEAAAVELLSNKPSLLITDIRLKDAGSGIRVAEAAVSLRPRPCVIAVSGEATSPEAFQLARLGVSGYLQKPLDFDTFVATIEALLEEPEPIESHIALQVGRRSYPDVLQQVRRTMIEQALAKTGGNRMHAAKILQVTRQAVQQMIRQLDVAEGGVARRQS